SAMSGATVLTSIPTPNGCCTGTPPRRPRCRSDRRPRDHPDDAIWALIAKLQALRHGERTWQNSLPIAMQRAGAYAFCSASPERGSHHMTWDGSPAPVRPVNQHLWKKFVHIAQPYFYPLVRGGGWIMVLFLSIAVTGINVGFSYIGNFFTNALVHKDQAQAYLFVGVYFAGFLLGIPIVALYGYMQSSLGLRWREWLTDNFLGAYFQGRTYYDIEITAKI